MAPLPPPSSCRQITAGCQSETHAARARCLAAQEGDAGPAALPKENPDMFSAVSAEKGEACWRGAPVPRCSEISEDVVNGAIEFLRGVP